MTREEQRPKTMGTIGVSIGLAFAVSMVAGPILAPLIGLKGLFFITSLGALVGIAIVHFMVPNIITKAPRGETVAVPKLLGKLMKDPQLLRLNIGIFTLHMTLTAVFIALPLQLQTMHLAASIHWELYLPALLFSFLLIIPMLIVAAKKELNRQFFLSAILMMGVSLAIMSFTEHSLIIMFLCVLLYFTAFNFLEASLPAFISMLAPAGAKGSAMGIYSTYQFLGAFFGGILGGFSYKLLGSSGLLIFLACLMLIWFFISWGMNNPNKVRTHTLTANINNELHAAQLTEQLIALTGVLEVVIIIEEQVVYIKVDNKIFSLESAKQILTKLESEYV